MNKHIVKHIVDGGTRLVTSQPLENTSENADAVIGDW